MRRKLLAACSLVVMVLLSACGGSAPPQQQATSTQPPPSTTPAGQSATSQPPAPSQPGATTKVKIGVIGLLSDAGIFIALEKGYFKEQGFELEMHRFTTGADMMPHLASGNLDVAAGGVNPGLFNAVANGLPLALVADKGSLPKGRGFNVLVVRRDLADAVKSARELRGRIVAVESEKSLGALELDLALKAVGLSMADVKLEIIPFPDMVAALANKKVDAAITVEPFATVAVSRDAATILQTMDEILENGQIGAVFYGGEFAKKPDLATRWMVAYIKGLRLYNDSFNDPEKRKEVVEILRRHTAVKDAAIYEKMIWPGLNPDGYLNTANLMDQQNWFKARGDVNTIVPVDKLVNHTFIDAALKQLGKSKP